jgi:SAM-dependent methyltransferase
MSVPHLNFSPQRKSGLIMRCGDCFACFLDPIPTKDELKELYEQKGVFSQPYVNPFRNKMFYGPLQRLFQRLGADDRFVASLSLKHCAKASPSVLDVGCSTGALMTEILRQSPNSDVFGIDIDPGAKERAPSNLQERIEVSDIFDYRPNRKFDLVTVRFVIEHLADPSPFISRCLELLAPGGCLMVSTPDIGSARALRLKDKWEMISHPDMTTGHCVWFDHASMRNILAGAGADVIEIRNRGEVIDHFPTWLQKSIYRVFGSHPSGRRPFASFQIRMLWASLIDGVMSEKLSVGSCLYAFARRPI